MVQKGILPMHAETRRKVEKKPSSGERQWVLNETQEVPSEYQEIIFHCRDDKTLAQVTQRGCALCFLANLQKPLDKVLGQTTHPGPA